MTRSTAAFFFISSRRGRCQCLIFLSVVDRHRTNFGVPFGLLMGLVGSIPVSFFYFLFGRE
jgi:hypothetical protein